MAAATQDCRIAATNYQAAPDNKEATQTATDVQSTDTQHDYQHSAPDQHSSLARRCVSIAGHVYVGWLCWLLTVLVFAVTVAYAFRPSTFTNSLTTVGSSISNSILTLRLLSGITDIMLSVTFAAALDRLQVILINGPRGTALAKALAVHSGTSYVGLAVLGFGSGSASLAARGFAVGRLLVMLVIPVLGIIIMSDVNTQQASTNALTWTLINTEGVSFFNASRAPLVAVEIDRVFSNSMTTWLSNSEHAVDITPDDDRIMSCAQLAFNGTAPTCERVIYMPGSVPVALVTDERKPEADLQIAFDIKGCVLRFGKSDVDRSWSFNATDCITLGLAQGAARLCLVNNEPNVIQAKMISCPLELANQKQQCLTNTSWHSGAIRGSNTVTTTLRTNFRRADVAFHRANSSIAWHRFIGEIEEDAPIAAQDLLAAYEDFALGSGSMANSFQRWSSDSNNAPVASTDTSTDSSVDSYIDSISDMLNASSTSNTERSTVKARMVERQLESSSDDALADFSSLFTAFTGTSVPGSNPIFPMVPFMYLQVCTALAAHNSRTSTICTDFLQNFLAIPLSWCDNLVPLRAQGGGLLTTDLLGPTPSDSEEDSTAAQLRSFLAYLGLDDATAQRLRNGLPDTRVALAKLRYEIIVGRPSLFAYMAISIAILALCFAILVVGTRDLESPGYWPLLDAMIKYAMMSNGRVVDGSDTRDLDYTSQRRLIEDTRVTRR
ncbi:hypothetical protein LTR17_013769 [Elasticomyces elasticus]|nr:hypothetical protein LTR17_013769 [Elasticomyces elasticus]